MCNLFKKFINRLIIRLKFWSKTENSRTTGASSHNQRAGTINNYNFSSSAGSGGRGGSATVGGNGTAIGGSGGNGGVGGTGGDGGSGHVKGDGIVLGGEGGEAGQLCKGGKGGRSPVEAHDLPNRQLPDGSWLWDYGRGGDGASLTSDKTAAG